MPTIEIDFEVFKQLTVRRETESMSCNDVIRGLLAMPSTGQTQPELPHAGDANAWTYKGISFPIGTEFRCRYKGAVHSGRVVRDGLQIGTSLATSPSDAARLVTQTNVNGWNFWECRLPGEPRWRTLKALRDNLSGTFDD